jgi:hypothetical protein
MQFINNIFVISILIPSIYGFEVGNRCIQQEVPRMNVVSHPHDCTKFFSCNGTWIEESCPSGQQFDISAGRCKLQIFEFCPEIKSTLKNVLPALDHHSGEKCYFSSKNQIFYPHPKNCEKYLKCVNGYWREQDCPVGLYFSWFYNKCEWPEVAMCSLLETKSSTFYVSSKLIRKPPILEEVREVCPEKVRVHPGDCSKFLECHDGEWEEKMCPYGLGFDGQTLHCEWNVDCLFPNPENSDDYNYNEIERPSMCLEEYRSHETDCQKFYQCAFGRWHEKNCPAGLHFSIKSKQCEWPAIAGCQAAKPNQTGCCSVPVRPNPIDCKSYYQCLNNGEWILENCQDDYEFNHRTNRCEPPSTAGCSNNPEIPTAPTPIPTSSSIPEIQCSQDGSVYPNPEDCSMLKICSGGKLVDLSCPENLYFDIKLKRCVEKSMVHCVVP